ncbi:MAG: cbb3-type cytochrome c oxidase subunit 3 [Bacteriovorax sp.]|nr:cbb3-type cytochrome c oxidase subunit 3 [Bacteriovorax sp.]
MHTEVLSRFDQPWLPILALIIFLTCFLSYVFWTFKKENKNKYDHSSYMPLHDGVKHER